MKIQMMIVYVIGTIAGSAVTFQFNPPPELKDRATRIFTTVDADSRDATPMVKLDEIAPDGPVSQKDHVPEGS